MLAKLVATTDAIVIAGGHVAVLANRLRLFDIAALAGARPIVAWSAGAMALAERVVLYHDHPPQGAAPAELLDRGLGLVAGVLPLPDAARRLALEACWKSQPQAAARAVATPHSRPSPALKRATQAAEVATHRAAS